MQPRTLLVLTLAVLGLGAFIFFYEKDLPSTDERAEQAKKVLRIEDEAVDALLIEWADHSVRLERERTIATGDAEADDSDVSPTVPDDGWRIVAPLEARADRAAVDSLLSSLTGLEASRAFEDFDRAELGLDDPRVRVTLITGAPSGPGEGNQSVLEIGAELPTSNDMVVAVAGDTKAHQVVGTLFDDLTKEAGDWRDKKLFPSLRGDIDRLSWSDVSGEDILLAKRGDHFWIESPLTDRANEELVNTLLSELTGLRAESFVDEPLLTAEGMGLEPPQGTLEVVLAGQEKPFRLELGVATTGDEGVVYGRADSQLFEVKTQLPESLAVPAADWRSKSWTGLQVFKIESARFKDQDGAVEVRRDGADWTRGDDRIGYTTVSDVLYPITEARGAQVLDRDAAVAAGHDLERASLTIALGTGDDDPQSAEELSLFVAVDGYAAATSGGRDAVLLLAEDTASELMDKLQALRDAEPLPSVDEKDVATDGSEPVAVD